MCFMWALIGYGRDAYGRLGRDKKERALLMVRRALCLFVRGECLIVELAELALDGEAAGAFLYAAHYLGGDVEGLGYLDDLLGQFGTA